MLGEALLSALADEYGGPNNVGPVSFPQDRNTGEAFVQMVGIAAKRAVERGTLFFKGATCRVQWRSRNMRSASPGRGRSRGRSREEGGNRTRWGKKQGEEKGDKRRREDSVDSEGADNDLSFLDGAFKEEEEKKSRGDKRRREDSVDSEGADNDLSFLDGAFKEEEEKKSPSIMDFFNLAVPEDFYNADYTVEHYGKLKRYKKSDIQGAEWWIQARGSKEGIGFHYDKDEAYASLQMRMSFPVLSTITYLTDVGAPTLILNQTSLDGSVEYPEVPSEGFLSYPKKNRHVIFRGDLNHGVSKTLSLDEEGSERVTLLVNWWISKPLEPNCMVLTDDLATEIGLNYPSEVASHLSSAGSVSGSQSPVNSGSTPHLNVTGTKQKEKGYKRHLERFPPNDAFYYDMPKNKALSAGSLYAVTWSDARVFGHTGMLDLYNTNQVAGLFRDPLPKLLVFVHEQRDLDSPTGINWWLQPLARRLGDRVKVYTATKDKAKGAWEAFGLKEGDLPIAVMHDTKEERKMVMEREGTFGMGKVEKLIEEFGISLGREEEVEVEGKGKEEMGGSGEEL
ncbi:hypothetical protein TrRE_jg11814 [Triparma retinervis]|uniref:Uncharacterized protein n=1 Tax=Triparma retinervis TaxID=2557542 RepID=A0A9W6ZJ19_9STRA|nr:hypothetical protein TrRE_jg11814 [Triparma retinervis]